jgi:hypothetical protein
MAPLNALVKLMLFAGQRFCAPLRFSIRSLVFCEAPSLTRNEIMALFEQAQQDSFS